MVAPRLLSRHKFLLHDIGSKSGDGDSSHKIPTIQIEQYLQCILQDRDSCKGMQHDEEANVRDADVVQISGIIAPNSDEYLPLAPGVFYLRKLAHDCKKGSRKDCLAWNLSLILRYPDVKLLLPPSGTLCRGSRRARYDAHDFIPQPCPFGNDVSLETGRIRRGARHCTEGWEEVFQLNQRCHCCERRMGTVTMLQRLELLDETGEVDSVCTFKGCSNKRFIEYASVCGSHFLRKQNAVARPRARQLEISMDIVEIFRHLQVSIESLGFKWTRLKSAVDKVSKQETMETSANLDFVFVDSEFNALGDEVEIYEATFIGTDGKELLDVTIDWGGSLLEMPSNRTYQPPASSRHTDSGVYSKCKLPAWGKQVMTISQLAQAMKRCGINRNTTIVEWSMGACDTRILACVFDRFGIVDTLDPTNCIGVIPAWTRSFSECPMFRLDVFFPLVFPRSPLVGKNQISRPDTEMLHKLVILLLGLTEPTETRDLNSFYPEDERPERQVESQRQRQAYDETQTDFKHATPRINAERDASRDA
ncbi:hypothetical protein GQ607_013110 [Colletotrichum asianum]|uniref:Uncharacterized protein n=1 Tax=Colletotrichum asianum TaxID=702518 RepID=A0A8H3ZQ29_9PEZI|nr:hypothetical protein GQ607_013110 [Colletotrichum asianum]